MTMDPPKALFGQFTNPQVFEFHRGSFGFKANETGLGIALCAAGYFSSIDPKPDLAVNRPNVVMVPFSHAQTEIF